ncbi:MAG: hypothetical protein V3S69_07575 [Dehalococcoidales bacterium]
MSFIRFIGWWSPGATVTLVIRRKSDGYYWTGSAWQAGATTVATTEDTTGLGSAIMSAYYSGTDPDAPHAWAMKTAGGDIIAGDPGIDVVAIQKNKALDDFEFLMVSSIDHVSPLDGLSVNGERSLDGGAFVSVNGAIAEISNGIYNFDALAADTNCNIGTWRFYATGADDTFITFMTKP